jgi:hypothetical protein
MCPMLVTVAALLLTNLATIESFSADAPSPWPSFLLEDRLAKANVVVLGRWGEISDAAIYESSGVRVVYTRREFDASRVFVGSLPRHTNILVRGGAGFDRKTKRYVVDDEETVYLPPNPGTYTVLLRHLSGRDYELVDGLRGFLSAPAEAPGEVTALIATRRRELMPPGSIVAAKTPSPDIAAARVSLDQLGEILDRLVTESDRDSLATDAPTSHFVRSAKALDRKAIVEDLAATADRLIAARTGGSFFREHLVREVNPQWIPPPIGGPHIHKPSEEWRGIGVAYRLRAFGKTSDTTALSVVVGPDRSILNADRIPDCKVESSACEFRIDESAAVRIATDDGFAERQPPWKTNLHWEPSCRAFVWFIMYSPSDRDGKIILVTTGSGKVCGKQEVTTIQEVIRPYQKVP